MKARGILFTAVSAHALIHVCELSFPATALLVTEDLLGGAGEYMEMGLATTLFGFLFGFTALPSGKLVDRFGPRTILVTLLFGVSLCMFALAMAPSFTVFSLVLAFLGAFAGLYHPAGTTMLSLGLEEHGKAMGYHGVGGNLGLAVTPFFVAALAEALDWRTAYAMVGAMPLALGVVVLATGVGKRADKAAGDEALPAGPDAEAEEAGAAGGARPYRLWPLAFIFAMAFFNGMTYRGLMTFLPTYFAERVDLAFFHSFPKAAVGGGMTTAILLLGVAGQFSGGWLADRIKKEKLYAGIFFIAAPALATLGYLHDLPLVAVTGVFAFLYFMNQPVGNAIIPSYTKDRVRGFVFGLYFFMSFGTGSVMSIVAGYIGERFELSSIFTYLAACIGFSALLGIGLVLASRKGWAE